MVIDTCMLLSALAAPNGRANVTRLARSLGVEVDFETMTTVAIARVVALAATRDSFRGRWCK